MAIQPLPVKLHPHFFKGKKQTNNNSIFKQDLYPSSQDVHFVKWNTTAIILAQQTAFSISWCKPPLLEKKSTACLSSLVLSPVIANTPLKKTKNRQTKEAPCNLYLHSGVWAERMMLAAEQLPHHTLITTPPQTPQTQEATLTECSAFSDIWDCFGEQKYKWLIVLLQH